MKSKFGSARDVFLFKFFKCVRQVTDLLTDCLIIIIDGTRRFLSGR